MDMNGGQDASPPFQAVGQRLKRLRETKGLTRRELAGLLDVDVTSLAGWEGGKRLPRDGVRLRLSRTLGVDPEALFATDANSEGAMVAASLVDTISELGGLLLDLTNRANNRLRALRLAAPYPTPSFIQTEWRKRISERVQDGSLEVLRIEIFYDLKRLQEVLSNVMRYHGRRYYVKSHCTGIGEVIPSFGGYYFDEDEFLVGAYWTGEPPHNRPGLRLSGAPFRTFFNEYWDEIWRRGTLLNFRGASDLSEIRKVALQLGLKAEDWSAFVEEAKSLDMGDDAPPLI